MKTRFHHCKLFLITVKIIRKESSASNNTNSSLADSLYAMLRNSQAPRLFSRLVKKTQTERKVKESNE
jgi:hypothetical protein